MVRQRLFEATSTVETQRRNIMRKLGIHSVANLTKYAIREGLNLNRATNGGRSHRRHSWLHTAHFPCSDAVFQAGRVSSTAGPD